MGFVIKKATKTAARGRVALIGPSGSGKTWTALEIARALGQRVCVIDTERGSASKYSDRFDFSVLELDTFAPGTYVEALRAVEAEGFDVVVVDSLSHAWMGKDGALEQVDKAAARSQSRNSFDAWRQITPQHNRLVDALLACKAHLVVTMRSKTEYVIEEDSRGKKVPRKVGLAPVQRDGLEYEFDVVGEMDLDHRLSVSKSRCAELADAVIERPGADLGKTLRAWLSDGVARDPAPAPAQDAPQEQSHETPAQLAEFYARLKDIELPGEAVAVWMKHRGDLGALPAADRESAWKALCRRTEEVGKMKDAKVWLKKCITEEDARRVQSVDPGAALEDAGSPRAETPRSDMPPLASLGVEVQQPAATPAPVDARPAEEERGPHHEDAPPPAEGPLTMKDLLESFRVSRSPTEVADRWVGSAEERRAWSGAERTTCWTEAVLCVAAMLKCSRASAEEQLKRAVDARRPKVPGPKGGTPKPEAPAQTEAQGDSIGTRETMPAPAQASADAWRETAEGITAHVAKLSAGHIENSGRLHLRAIREDLQTHAVHVYAGRVQRLSYDGSSSKPWDECVATVERWLREGPRVTELRPRTRTAPARRAVG